MQRAKGERGERVGTAIPYGYMKNPDNSKQLTPDPEAAAVVKRIFDMYASGIGIRKICATFEKEHITNPGVYNFRKTGNRSKQPLLDTPYRWTQTTVRDMLSNQAYCGDTVNFKTYSKSNKLKKRLKNNPENMRIFENTHEAIVSRKLFETVQKHFEGRKRPDIQGEMDKYAGYLYCGNCGKRLYLHRAKSIKPENNFFQCGGYQTKGNNHCTTHYIREAVLDEIVLTKLHEAVAFARLNSDEFYAIATENGKAEAKRFYVTAEKEKSRMEGRIKELDNIIRCLYEDRVSGRITPERYDIMASGYEQEQSELKLELSAISTKIDELDMQETCVREFVEHAKQYIEMPKLTPELLRVFIRRIDVYEKEEKFSRKCGNPVVIHFTFESPVVSKTESMLDINPQANSTSDQEIA